MTDWDDLRYVLAVARTGSALQAARVLGVNQTTVIRRLAALEAGLGVTLFERARSGQALTAEGRRVAQTAERIEAKVLALDTALRAEQRTLRGVVRLTTSEGLANRIVAPCIGEFQDEHPDVAVELMTAIERLDVARGDADVALRGGVRPEGAGIVARRLPDVDWSVYCSRRYAERHGAPASPGEVGSRDVVSLEGPAGPLPAVTWLLDHAPDARIRMRSNSLMSLVANLRAGLGLGVLPAFIGDVEPDLLRCFPPVEAMRSELWLIVREDVKGAPHVRAFTDFLARYIRKAFAELGAEAVSR